MIRFKACPKCGGDLSLTEDIFGRYWNCLQCGLNREIADRPQFKQLPEFAPEELRRAA